MVPALALIYKDFFPSISTFETPPSTALPHKGAYHYHTGALGTTLAGGEGGTA
jgi:hypothetical protein